MTTHNELLYKKYKYYGFNENATTLKLLKHIILFIENYIRTSITSNS